MNLVMNKSNSDLEFVVKTYQNFAMEHGGYAILLLVMRHGFIMDSLVRNQAMLLGLVEMSYQGPLFVEIDLNLEHCFVYSSNQMVLFLYIKLIKATRLIINITLNIVSNLLSMQYDNKKNYHAQSVSNCLMIMAVLIFTRMLLTI